MKKIKLIILIVALAFFASVFVCEKAFAEVEPWNVLAEIQHNGKVFRYDLKKEMQYFVDNADARGFYLGAQGKRALAESLVNQGLPPEAVWEYLLPNFSKIVKYFGFVNVAKRDATVRFDQNGFHFTQQTDGVSVNRQKLFAQLLESRGKVLKIQLPLAIDKAVSVEDLKVNTVPKATFTTHFANSGANRCQNVKRATDSLNGTTVNVGESFSFNKIVGKRTEQNGYLSSKVIMDGNYVDGVGGGVCQVSTTLYNALLLAEILPKAYQHSLVSSYVLAGFDAMVSDNGADLTFVNNTDQPLYIQGSVNMKNKSVTFTIFGKPNCHRVVRENIETRTKFETVEIVDSQKYPELIFTDQTKVITNGSDGVVTQSYLNFFDGDVLVERKLIRKNTYKQVNKVVARGAKERPETLPTEE